MQDFTMFRQINVESMRLAGSILRMLFVLNAAPCLAVMLAGAFGDAAGPAMVIFAVGAFLSLLTGLVAYLSSLAIAETWLIEDKANTIYAGDGLVISYLNKCLHSPGFVYIAPIILGLLSALAFLAGVVAFALN